MRKYAGLAILCLTVSFLAGCKTAAKKTADDEGRTPASSLVGEGSTEAGTTKEGQATSQQVATAIKGNPIPGAKIPEGIDFKTPAEISPEAARIFKNINFDFDKYDIRPDAREILKGIGKYLLQNPKTAVLIAGHCDDRGTREYNLVLGEQRALSTRRFLVSLGVSPDRLHTVSYGKDMPLDTAATEEAWAANRRAEFKISQ